MPVSPAMWEAEVRGLLSEAGSGGWGGSERPYLKNTYNNKD
jgi:hypothetical protein